MSWLDVSLWPCHDPVTDFQLVWRDNIAFLSVYIVQQCDTSRVVRIILVRGYPGGNPQFVALEINNTVVPLGTTATMTCSDLALVVAPSVLLQSHYQRFLWLCLGNLLEGRNRHATTPRRGWSVLSNWHFLTPYAFNASIVCPSRKVTTAFFHSRASFSRGAEPLRRLYIMRALPGMRMVLTETTLTLNIASTARRISILFASNATLKVYLFCFCRDTDFSVTIPWRSTSVISTIIPPLRLQLPRHPRLPHLLHQLLPQRSPQQQTRHPLLHQLLPQRPLQQQTRHPLLHQLLPQRPLQQQTRHPQTLPSRQSLPLLQPTLP